MMTAREFKAAAREPFAWPGGYPTALLMSDGESICSTCARSCAREILSEIHSPGAGDASWQPEARYVNWEDTDLLCANCNTHIASAYGDD